MIKGLNSYRTFAFLSVFLYHMGYFKFGYMGVHAFFVLSGFLLTPIILKMKESYDANLFFLNFYGRRSLRIFPLYFLYLSIISCIASISLNYFQFDVGERFSRTQDQVWYAVTYTYNFLSMSGNYKQTQTLSHFWSLALEEQFYIIWPVILFLIPNRLIKTTLLFLILTGPVIRTLVAFIVMYSSSGVFNRIDIAVYTFTFSNFDAFAIGGYCSLYMPTLNNCFIFALAFILILMGFYTDYFFDVSQFDLGSVDYLKTLGYTDFMQDSYKFIWGYTAFSIVFGLSLVKIKNKDFFPSLFENSILSYLGKISYGMYVFHYPIVYFGAHKMKAISFYIQAPTFLVITIGISALSFHLFEARFLKLKDKYFHLSHAISKN